MPTLTLNMICRNEAPRIARALRAAARVCDDMIVVDTGSTDDTVAIAEREGATVLHFPWCDDFAAARNHALDNTAGDWVLVLDADDDIAEADIVGLRNVAAQLHDGIDVVLAPYRYSFEGETCTSEMLINRLVRRSSGRRWQRPIHESIDTDGASVATTWRFAVEHRTIGKVREPGFQRRILEGMVSAGDRTARTLWLLANIYTLDGEIDRALPMYDEIASRDHAPPFERYDALRTMFYEAAGRNADSSAIISRMLVVDPAQPDAHIFSGLLALDRGDTATAIDALETAARLVATHDVPQRWLVGTVATRDLYTRTLPAALAEARAIPV